MTLSLIYYYGRGSLWEKPDPYHYKFFERPQLENVNAESTAGPAQTRNVLQKMDETQSDVVIFWGSQSGTAEAFAHRLGREFNQRFHKEALVMDLSDYDPVTITLLPPSTIVVFLLATYGEGDPCDNTWDLVNWLKTQTSVVLKNLNYAAFGLGNSKYRFYNKVVTDIASLLDRLGATNMLSSVGKGDEAKRSTEEDFIDWKEALFTTIRSNTGLVEYEAEYQARAEIMEDNTVSVDNLSLGKPILKHTSKKLHSKASSVVALPIREQLEITTNSSPSKSCSHIVVDLSSYPEIKYKTGDHISIWPANPVREVAALLRLLRLEPKRTTPIKIQTEDSSLHIPSRTTIDALFTHYLDICGPVKRDVVRSLAHFATTNKARSFLRELGNNKTAYATFLDNNYVTFPRLLQYTIDCDPEASWSSLPLSFFVESIPAMRPRTYSISSSSMTSPRQATITVAVESTPLPSNPSTLVPGLASTYLSSDACKSLYAQIVPSTFKLPFLSKTPLVMVAAGTGIAPFRGFIQERARLASTGRPVGQMLLFFGCQHPDRDHLYWEELHELVSGPLQNKLEIVTAFSRLGDEKMYVQHRLREMEEQVMHLLLQEDAAFYVCGSAAMARAVECAVTEGVAKSKGWAETEVEAWRQDRKRAKLWHEDVWG